jgi:hypothetical protein
LDLFDFGDPTPAEEQRIRDVLAAWQRDGSGLEGTLDEPTNDSLLWLVGLALAVAACWLFAQCFA